jgi:hypothetical protein
LEKKTIFIQNKICQNRFKGVFAKHVFRPKIPQQKSNQPNKALVLDLKQHQSG